MFVCDVLCREVIYNGLTHYISGAGDVLIVEGYVGLIETNKPVSAMAVTPQASGLVDEELIFPLKSVIVDQYTFSTLEYSVTGMSFTLSLLLYNIILYLYIITLY